MTIQILVVDDFRPWHDFISELLKSETNLKIIAFASDGLEAVRKAQQLQPDVILMDINLPGQNGFEAVRQIRSSSPGSKILFLSGLSGPEVIEGAFEAGGLGYVLKSDANADLILGIRTILLNQQFVSRSLRGRREP